MLSPEPSCPYNPSIDSVDTTPDILDTDKLDNPLQKPIALRKSKREKKAPDVLTYPVAETAPKSKRVSKGKDSATKVKELKAFVDSKKASGEKKPKTDTMKRPNFWAMKQAWLNKIRKLRQDPEYIKKQQAIVAKFKSEYIPYKWNKDLSTYENLYRSNIKNQGMKLPHDEIIKSVNLHIKTALPINTTPLSLSVSPEQLTRLKLTSMPIDKAMEIVQNISSDQDEPMIKFMKYMEALRTIEKLPKNMAIPTIVPQSRVESIPIAQPLFELNDTNKKAMSIVEDYLERKYENQTEIDNLLGSHGAMETKRKLPATCSMDVMMDSMLTNLEENILTDEDLNNFEKEIEQIVMEKHGISSRDDPNLKQHIEEYMKTLPELTESDFEDAEFATQETGDLISKLSKSLEKLSIGDTPKSPPTTPPVPSLVSPPASQAPSAPKVGDKRGRGIGKAITAKLKFRRPKKLLSSKLKVFKKPSIQKMKTKPKPNTTPKPKKLSQYGGTRKKHKTKRHKAKTRRMRGKKHMRKIRGGHYDTLHHS